MSKELVQLIKKGRARAFEAELEATREQKSDGDEELISLEGATFKGLNLSGFHFDELDLTNVEFDECVMEDCHFTGCLLEGTYIQGSTLFGCVFSGCKGEGFALDTCTIDRSAIKDCEFTSCEWSDLQINDGELRKVMAEEPLWERLTFRQGTIKEVILLEGELSHVTLRDTEYSKDGLKLESCTTQSCYIVGDSPALEGFAQKSGRRRTF